MVPTPEIKTAVQVTFPGTNLIEGSLRDYKNHVDVDMIIPDSSNKSKVVSAILVVSRYDNGTVSNTKTYALKKDGSTSIGTPASVGSNDVKYEDANGNSFQDSIHYSFKLKAAILENDGTVNYHNASFTEGDNDPTQSYDYVHRDDTGDKFIQDDMTIVNALEIQNGSEIEFTCPMNFVNEEDSDRPTHLLINFDAVDQYAAGTNTDNSEELHPFSAILDFNENGEYTIENNDLDNDNAYVVSATAIYPNGYTTSATFQERLYCIAKPVIQSLTSYGLGVDKDDAGDSTTDTVMNVSVAESTNPEQILPVSGNVKFIWSQDGTVFYSATVSASDDGEYTIYSSDLTKVWEETHPTRNPDQSYDYDITMEIEYTTDSGPVIKTSNSVAAKFTDDINQLSSVQLVNGWYAACNVMGEGNRTVDISDETTAEGYDVADGFGMIAYFPKHDSFGNGNTNGFDHDLDLVDTKFQIKMSVNGGAYQVVQNLFMIQSDNKEKTVQQNAIDISSLTSDSKQTNVNGVFDNIPGAGVVGSEQPDIYIRIDEDELTRLGAVQGNGIKLSVTIQPPADLTTRPGATESNQVALVHKVNSYSMTLGTDSEPTFTGSGSDGILSIPINNPTIPEGDLYFIKSIVTINSYTPTEDNVQDVIDDGIYNHLIENPLNRGTSDPFKYEVAFKVDDPNGERTITGPRSVEYQIYLKDEPTVANFTISNFEYKVFNDDSESSFQFNVQFNDVGDTSIDGINAYWKYGEEDEVLVGKVQRSDGNSQSNLTVTLTTLSAESSSSSDGIYVKDIDGDAVSYIWPNFTDANIVFKPYYTPKVQSSNDEPVEIDDTVTEPILNIPVIDLPADVSLTGGVIESYTGTVMAWNNDLDKYDGAGSIAASFHLEENTQDVTTSIANNDSFVIDLGNTPSTYTMDLSVKVASNNVDERVFYSKSVVLVFDSVSVNMSGMTVTTRRGSADINLKAEYVDYTTDPESAPNLNVTAVELVDNPDENVDPQHAGIRVLDCTSTEDAVQPPASTINTYSIANDYILADKILATMRMEAGVDYSLQYGDDAASNEESTPQYLTLNGPVTSYIVGKRPEATVDGSSYVVPSGTYADQTAIPMKLDAKGLKKEGLLSVVVGLVKEHDHTDNNDADDGAEIVLAFESSNGRLRSYTTQLDAVTTTGSLDNLGANETHVLSVNDVGGFSGTESEGEFTLVTGSLDDNDDSVLYLPADSEFAGDTLNVVAFMSTRLGTDFTLAQVTPNPN